MRRMLPFMLLVAASACGMGFPRGVSRAPEPPSGTWIGQIIGTVGAGGSLRGEIRLAPTARPGEYRVAIDMRTIAYNARHPWHIRTGSCGEMNAAEVSSRAVPQVEGRPDGTGALQATIRAPLDPFSTYHVVFTAGRGTADAVVACAPLTYVG
jgi:hypothetical protein